MDDRLRHDLRKWADHLAEKITESIGNDEHRPIEASIYGPSSPKANILDRSVLFTEDELRIVRYCLNRASELPTKTEPAKAISD